MIAVQGVMIISTFRRPERLHVTGKRDGDVFRHDCLLRLGECLRKGALVGQVLLYPLQQFRLVAQAHFYGIGQWIEYGFMQRRASPVPEKSGVLRCGQR